MRTDLVSRLRNRRQRQRGMTLLEIMIVLAILALVMGLVVVPNVYKYFQESKEETQKLAVKKLANEGFLHWARKNQGCPSSLAEVAEELGKTDTKDVWGRELIMFCGDNLPPGVKGGFAVMSLGPDGQQGTADDIKSWE
jgi:general secretion pathway protein G